MAACSTLIGADDVRVVDSLDDAGEADVPTDAGGTSDAPRDGDVADAGAQDGASVVPPDPACLVPETARPGFTFDYEPSPPHAGDVAIVAHESTTGFTHVGVSICTPASPVAIVNESATTFVDASTFTWRFAPIALPAGESQISFHADPAAKVYATTRVVVLP